MSDAKSELAQIRKSLRRENVVPVALEFPADLLTPVAAFLRLAADPKHKAFLFESVEGGERLARYSFLGVDPFLSLAIDAEGRLLVNGRPDPAAKRPLQAIGQRLAGYRSLRRPGLPPFTGGAVGYVGYECVRHLERVPVADERAGPFEAYLMLFRGVVAFDHVRHSMVLVRNVFLDEESLEDGYRRAQRELTRLRAALARPSAREKPLALAPATGAEPVIPGLQARMGEARFRRAVGEVKEAIRRGDIFQCVLSDEFRFPLKSDPFTVYRSLRRTSPAPYLFYLAMEGEVLLGASPEMLCKVGDGVVESCPIAGTRPRGRDPQEDRQFERSLLDSVKERAEHLMLVDLGRNDIGRVAKPGTVRVREFMQVHRFSHVMHLVSTVEGRLKSGLTAWDALLACFPAGTLSGAPKIRAMNIISRLEAAARGPYGGAVVYHDFSGRMDSCITIRSLYVRDGVGRIRAGAGVVADSQAAREYQEVRNKTRAMRRAVEAALPPARQTPPKKNRSR